MYNTILTTEQLKEMVEYYLAQDAFCYDVETVGDRRGDTPINEVLWISFATHGRCDVIPMGHPNGDLLEIQYPLTGQGEKRVEQGLTARPSDYSRDIKKATKVFSEPPAQLYPAEVFNALKPLMFSDKLKIGHNILFDLTSVAKYYGGKYPPGPYFCTMVGSFVYSNLNKNKVGLDDCLKREFGYEMVKGIGAMVEAYPFADVAKYAYLDAKYTWLLWKAVDKKLKENDVEGVMKLEMDVLNVLCDMRLTGAPIDTDGLQVLNDKIEVEIEAAKAQVFRVAGQQFNMNSNADKARILYGKKSEGGRGLKSKITTAKGGDSVSAQALESYRGEDELVDALLAYADLNKLQSTYIIPYLGGEVLRTTGGKSKREQKDSLLINGRIHCDFVQHGAETGRFSSRNPNLQNIPNPKASENGKAIRDLFRAPTGYKLVVADYSQIEPRVIASFSKDPLALEYYNTGRDLYVAIGDTMGVDRSTGKVLVLAMSYGVGPNKISRQIGCTKQEAVDLLNRFSKEFPSILKYKQHVLTGTVKDGNKFKPVPFVKTILGRKRFLPEMTSNDEMERSGAERQAFNTKIQGSAADIIKLAMVRAHKMIPEGAKLILTVHDEIVTLTPDHLAEETAEAIRAAMEDIKLLDVPLIADVKIVEKWGDAK